MEKKTVFLFDDFNSNLLEYEKHNPTNEFLDSLPSSMFLPYIFHPTRINSNSKTLIIFSPILFQINLLQEISQQQSLIIYLNFNSP